MLADKTRFCYAQAHDSVRLNTRGGNINGLDEHKYILTDPLRTIVEISDQPTFSTLHTNGMYKAQGVYYESLAPPQGLDVGQLKEDIDFGEGNCYVISNSVEVQVSDNLNLGNKPLLRIRESGTYIIEVEDACGNVVSDTVDIQLTGDCVWPGDVNADGLVSILDFLALGIANGATGSSRPNQSSAWEAHASVDWNHSFDADNVLAPSIDFKHADANGDGSVDLQAIDQNIALAFSIDSLPLKCGPFFFY